VSGAGHGLGRRIAERFAELGARVFGCDVNEAGLRETELAGVTVSTVDLTDRAAAAAWIGFVEAAAGPVSVLVHSAGGVAGQVFRPLDEVSDADWDRVVAVNLGSAFALSRAAAPG
jgi:3-oxoacyl-[acyl-carrier protein] reductase